MCLSEAVRSWADTDTLRDNAGNGGHTRPVVGNGDNQVKA